MKNQVPLSFFFLPLLVRSSKNTWILRQNDTRRSFLRNSSTTDTASCRRRLWLFFAGRIQRCKECAAVIIFNQNLFEQNYSLITNLLNHAGKTSPILYDAAMEATVEDLDSRSGVNAAELKRRRGLFHRKGCVGSCLAVFSAAPEHDPRSAENLARREPGNKPMTLQRRRNNWKSLVMILLNLFAGRRNCFLNYFLTYILYSILRCRFL